MFAGDQKRERTVRSWTWKGLNCKTGLRGATVVKWVQVKSRMLVSASRENASVNTSLTMSVLALRLRSAWNARPATIGRFERPSAVGRMYHDAWTPLSLRASYPIRRRYDDFEMTGYCSRVRIGQETHKWGVEFKMQEEVVFIRRIYSL